MRDQYDQRRTVDYDYADYDNEDYGEVIDKRLGHGSKFCLLDIYLEV